MSKPEYDEVIGPQADPGSEGKLKNPFNFAPLFVLAQSLRSLFRLRPRSLRHIQACSCLQVFVEPPYDMLQAFDAVPGLP